MKQKWTEKPVTWGAYWTLVGVCAVISVVASVPYLIVEFEPSWWTELKDSVKNRFKKSYEE